MTLAKTQRTKRNQLAVSSWQLAVIRTTDYKTASSKKSTPPPGFSKLRFAYCILPTAICLLFALAVLASWRDENQESDESHLSQRRKGRQGGGEDRIKDNSRKGAKDAKEERDRVIFAVLASWREKLS